MSADTTVVIAAYTPKGDSEKAYTAKVVQAVERLHEEFALEVAKDIFLGQNTVWFTGIGALKRAKQFAALLAEEYSPIEYPQRPIIEIAADRLYFLTKKGYRRQEDTHKPSNVVSLLDRTPDPVFHFRGK